MRNMYNTFPEVVMADATYKLTDLRMPLFLMIGIDGDGHSQVVAVYLTCTETAAALTRMLEVYLSGFLVSALLQMTSVYIIYTSVYYIYI